MSLLLKLGHRVFPSPPRASIYLNIPKTATSFTRLFSQMADFLQMRRRLIGRRGSLSLPSESSLRAFLRAKRCVPPFFMHWSNLNNYTHFPHTLYCRLPKSMQKYTKLTLLRDAASWYVSWLTYDLYIRSFSQNRLERDMHLLLQKKIIEDSQWSYHANYATYHMPGDELKAYLLDHRREFIERFKPYRPLDRSAFVKIPLASYIWYTETFLIPRDLYYEWGLITPPGKIGWLTYQVIAILFENPAKLFSMSKEGFDEYFASGRYLQDIRCDYFLDQRNLTGQLGKAMTQILGYDEEIVTFLQATLSNENKEQLLSWDETKVSPSALKEKIKGRMDEESILPTMLEREKVYIQYIFPLLSGSPDSLARASPGRRVKPPMAG